MNLYRKNNIIRVILDDGTILFSDTCTEEFYKQVYSLLEEGQQEELIELFYPKYRESKENIEEATKLTQSSSLVTFEENAYYIKSISNITLPENLAKKIIFYEEQGDTQLLDTYTSFWKLLSCNPNSEVRNNLLWFIEKHDIKMTNTGLLITYRNVDLRNWSKFNPNLLLFISTSAARAEYSKEVMSTYEVYLNSEENNHILVEDIEDHYFKNDNKFLYLGNLLELYNSIILNNDELEFTDHHSHTMSIKLGKLVTIPRKEVNSDSNCECSFGLHLASQSWLSKNYYGSVGLRCLVSPADVCAVPYNSGYGKMRVCAYFPIGLIDYTDAGNVDVGNISSGLEYAFYDYVCNYEVNNIEIEPHVLEIINPTTNNIHTNYKNLKEIALKHINNK
jgi:hypothetical protein